VKFVFTSSALVKKYLGFCPKIALLNFKIMKNRLTKIAQVASGANFF
jgi:hypothetical protein